MNRVLGVCGEVLCVAREGEGLCGRVLNTSHVSSLSKNALTPKLSVELDNASSEEESVNT